MKERMRRKDRLIVHETHRLGVILGRVSNGDIRRLDPLWAAAIRSQETALGRSVGDAPTREKE